MILLVAPTEHDLHDYYRRTATGFQVSSLPERYGCDVVCITGRGLVGFQRKTMPDLSASLLDGRLYYELAQLQATDAISTGFLVIESAFQTTIDGDLIGSNLSKETVRSIIAKFASNGIATLQTDDLDDTARTVIGISTYLGSGQADIVRRVKVASRGSWGRVDSRSFALFFLQSFPTIGPKLAAAILDHFGTVPVAWTVTREELLNVPGIGPKLAKQLIDALNP